jgi:CheY-like chemotaxis protein
MMSVRDRRRRVLVIDDDAAFAEFVVATLDDAGYQALLARTPMAPAEIAALRLDALVLDLWLQNTPVGLDLLMDLRALPGLGDLPIVVCSADEAMLQEAVWALAQAADQVLLKPVERDRFLAALASAVG